MKINKIILPVLAGSMLMTACYDEKMEWHTPSGHNPVVSSEIPLELAEKIANYDYIKTYMKQYMPNVSIGLGLSVDKYLSDEAYRTVCNDNYMQFVAGNAMKHQSIVQANGSLKLETVNQFLTQAPEDIQVYGHNFIWHTQQNQTYLKTLIAPEVTIEQDADDVCENVVTNSGFEDGTTNGYTGLWGKYSYKVEAPGQDSEKSLHFTMSDETSVNYDCQVFFTTGLLTVGTTYAYSFWVKSDSNLDVQFIGQNSSYGGIYKDKFTATSDWVLCQGEFTYTADDTQNIERVGIQFGGTPGSNLWFDNFKFGKKIEDPMDNVVTNSGFENELTGWKGWSKYTLSVTDEESHGGKHSALCAINSESSVNYDSQLWWTLDTPLESGATYSYSFYIKSPDNVTVQFIGQNDSYSGIYKESFEAPSDWLKCEGEFTYDGSPADIIRVGLQFGGVPNTKLYVDDFKFGKKKAETRAAAKTRAGGVTYTFKTAEEKRTALLGAMESWIKGMCEATGTRVCGWDVVNEPITDGSTPGFRGIDGQFGGSITDDDGNTTYDSEPVEDPATGLTLNWANGSGNGHFYWGYYLGMDYAVKAFEYARKYAASGAKLYVNDYNLETNPAKLAKLIELVNYIDNHGASVDGIGTQMHVDGRSITKAEVDAMFKTMAATGKLVRISELDVRIGTTTPSATQMQTQSDVYQMIIESYKENVPDVQRGGITIWTLSDAADEHTYWYPDDAPNLFDKNYARKTAYKGVCDGIAGKDISSEFSGSMWTTGK